VTIQDGAKFTVSPDSMPSIDSCEEHLATARFNFARSNVHIRRAIAVFSLLTGICAFSQNSVFITPPQYVTAVGPTAVATGDFNADGKLDLAVVNACPVAGCSGSQNGVVSILLGNGDGTFKPHVDYSVGFDPSSLAVADINGDGQLDLVVTNQGSDTVSVLLGNGDGTFQSNVDYGAGGAPTSVAVADFNGDGKPDLAVVNSTGNSVSIFLNNGSGTFPVRQDFATGYFPISATTGDFNKDGKIDLAVATDCGNVSGCDVNIDGSVSVLLGNGDGTFQAHVDYAVGIQPVWIAAADLNGDSNLDLAVANEGGSPGGLALGGNVTILWGNGNGTFTAQNFTAGNSPDWIGVGDFNGDGQPDFAAVNATDATISIFLNQGQNSFSQPRLSYGTGYFIFTAAIGDFNGDQKIDLAVTCESANGTEGVCILLGNGSGGFQQATLTYPTGNYPSSAAVADVNADTKNDVVVTNFNDDNVSVFLGNGDGTLQPAVSYNTGTGPTSVAVADLNHDGNPDLVVANQTGNTVSALLNNGNGTFQSHVDYPTANGPTSVAIGDLNGDGNPDLAVACKNSNSVSILLGNGDGTFRAHSDFAVGVQPEGIAIGDFNGDGKPDVAVLNTGDATLTILLNSGNGTFSSFAPISLQRQSKNSSYVAIAVADLNGDGRLDVAVTGFDGALAILLGNGDGTFQTPSYYGEVNGSSIVIADFNGDGFPDVATGGAAGAELFLGNGDGTFQASPLAYVTGILFGGTVAGGDLNGDSNPDLVVLNGGSQGGSGTLTILLNSGVENPSFSLAASPGSQTVTAGKSINVAITVKAQNGFNNAVSLACGGLPSGVTCSFTPGSITPAAAGATATLTVNTSPSTAAGTYPLPVTGTSGDRQFTVTPSLVVSPAPPDFSISMPSSPTPNSVMPGESTTAVLSLASSGGFSATVNLACSVSPAVALGPTCSLSPQQMQLTSSSSPTSTLTTNTTGPSAFLGGPTPTRDMLVAVAAFVPLLGMAWAGLGKKVQVKGRNGLLVLLMCWLLAGGTVLQVSCGGTKNPSGNSGTPAGTYTVAVTASSSTEHTASLTLTVQ
jgi:hypothetical protein